jgi:hypothetical protein
MSELIIPPYQRAGGRIVSIGMHYVCNADGTFNEVTPGAYSGHLISVTHLPVPANPPSDKASVELYHTVHYHDGIYIMDSSLMDGQGDKMISNVAPTFVYIQPRYGSVFGNIAIEITNNSVPYARGVLKLVIERV